MPHRFLARFLRPEHDDFIWLLGFGYFIGYLPYSALTKATTKGLLPGIEAVGGAVILPLSTLITMLAMFLFVSYKGWWRYVRRVPVLGLSMPLPRWQTAISGMAAAVIIGTTTMAYSFNGVSILFSMVLMRGGVLLIGRITDAVAHRQVAWYSITGLLITFAALMVLFSENGGMALTIPAAVNLGLYLLGYTVRFQFIHKLTKTRDPNSRLRYLVEEQMVAMPALVLGLAMAALLKLPPLGPDLALGYTSIWSSSLLLPTLLIGLGFGWTYIFGTMIYLDHREYSFCTPINRASSILAGVGATYLLHFGLSYAAPSAHQLGSAALLVVALLVLAYPSFAGQPAAASAPTRLFLFVCGGNRLRSPLAQAICGDQLARLLGVSPETLSRHGIRVESAGLNAQAGAAMKEPGVEALKSLGISAPHHEARPLTTAMIHEAERVFCMTESQWQEARAMAPEHGDKVFRLDASADLEEPPDRAAALVFCERIGDLIKQGLPPDIAPKGSS